MNVLVIGETGQLSRCLQRLLPGASFVPRAKLDLLKAGTIYPYLKGRRPSAIVNAAAYTAVDRAEQEPDVAMQVNAAAVGEIARAAGELEVPLIHISTDFVFDGTATRPYRESDPVGPVNQYGRSKLAGEAETAANAGSHWWVLRTSWVFSEFGSNFVKTMVRLAASQPNLRVVADQRGRPTYAGHLAEAVVRLLDQWQRGTPVESGVFHFASSGEATWHELACRALETAREVGRIATVPSIEAITTADYPTPARRPAYSVLATGRIERALAWQIPDWQSSLTTALREP